MKLVVRNNDLYNKMEEAINMLCDTVKVTLGPKGANVIINKSMFSPFITNDGVTIAECIESDDKILNTILEIAKESSIKTNDIVGDGTTTTLVLLQSIFHNGLEMIRKGNNPIIIKRELDNSLKNILKLILNESRKPKDDELKYIATVSANDENIGNVISEAYLKTKNRDAVFIKESNNLETKINYLNGYIFESNLASNYFLKDLKEINLENVYVLLIDNYIDNINCLSDVLNYIILNNKSLVVIAKDYDECVINNILSLNIDNKEKIFLLKNPEYGSAQLSVLKDISAITNSKVVEKLDYVDTTYLGSASKIRITDKNIIINFFKNEFIENRVKELNNELILGEDNSALNKRIAMFSSGIVEIVVGEKTTTERREKKMRYDDALCAISSASNGVVPGGGLTLLKISNNMEEITIGDSILKKALQEPFEQILYNAGIDKNDVLKIIKENNYDVVFNLNNLKYENVLNTKILDSTDIVINSITSAVSIASMLLSTTSIVINEHENNLNKINDYNEI